MELGIIGLPKSGKTTVFNALTRGHAQTAPFRTAKIQPHMGVAKVPDGRLAALEAMLHPKRTVAADVQYVDIPGTPEGLGRSSDIGGEYLNLLQRCDALIHVVRAFQNPSVPHPEGSVDPYRDATATDLEMAFADMGILERRGQRIETGLKGARGHERDALLHEQRLLLAIKSPLGEEVPIREQHVPAEYQPFLENYQLLTAKPLLVVFNIGEKQLPEAESIESEMRQRLSRPCVECAALCGKLEMELAQMDPADEQEFRQSLGAGQSGLERAIRLSYSLLGLITFYTTASSEVRAWPIPHGAPAQKAAGRIHSDMERGFIRAEVVHFDDLQRCGDMAEARRRGLLHTEGKTYQVQDGDVITFLFNV